MTRSDKIIGTIRTYVPSAVGFFLAWLIAKVPAVADVIAGIDQQLMEAGFVGTTVSGLLVAITTALIVALYYWLVRTIGQRYPMVERWLLGSAKQPLYFQEADAAVVADAIPVPEYRDAQQTAGSSVIIDDETSKHNGGLR